MITSLLILISSAALFVYWFRYTCLLILDVSPVTDYAQKVAHANHLRFPDVKAKLETASGASSLDVLEQQLRRDYRFLSYVMHHATKAGAIDLEQNMLRLDFALMRAWYFVCRRVYPAFCKQALNEMSSIVSHFAHSIGEREAAVEA